LSIETAQCDIGSSCFFTLPGANTDCPVDFFRILRVAFMSSSPKRSSLTAGDPGLRRRNSASSPPGFVGAFTYETFTPELVARYCSAVDTTERLDVVDSVESMNETFAKVIAFLQNSGTHTVALTRTVKCTRSYNKIVNKKSAHLTLAERCTPTN